MEAPKAKGMAEMRLFISCFFGIMLCIVVSLITSQTLGTSMTSSILIGVGAGILTAALASTYIVDAFKRRLNAIGMVISKCIHGKPDERELTLLGSEFGAVQKSICQLLSQLKDETRVRLRAETKLREIMNFVRGFQPHGQSEGDLKALLRYVRQSAGANDSVILTYSAEEDAFFTRIKDGDGRIIKEMHSGSIDDSMWRQLLHRSEPIILRGGERDRFSPFQTAQQFPFDIILVPMRSGSQLIGVLVLAKGEDGFSHEEYEMAITGGQLFSLALRNLLLHERLTNSFIETIAALAEAVDAKDPYTRNHSKWVTEWAVIFGRWLNLEPSQIDALHAGGLMHDLGKIAVPDEVLRKLQPLTQEEFELIKQHPVKGAEILSHVSLPWDVIPIVLYHHERWDGKGYPHRLRGEEIPLLARILAIVDAFHAMTSDRAYRPSLPIEEALRRVISEAGKQFDPMLASSFVQLVSSNMSAFIISER